MRPYKLSGAPGAVATLLMAARAQGAQITRVKLAKLLYLADLKAVEELGDPHSGIRWRWLHYGPYDNNLLVIEDDLALAGMVHREFFDTGYGNKGALLRFTGTLEDIDVDAAFAKIVGGTVAKYGNLDSRTLKDLSYQTPPMIEAQQGGERGVVLDLYGNRPAPRVGAVLTRLRSRLKRDREQGKLVDEGDPNEMVREIQEWAPGRLRANEAAES